MKDYNRLLSLLVSTGLVLPGALHAQAFGLNEIGSCAIARGLRDDGVALQDASTIYWNSAAAAWLHGWNVSGGVASVAVNGSIPPGHNR